MNLQGRQSSKCDEQKESYSLASSKRPLSLACSDYYDELVFDQKLCTLESRNDMKIQITKYLGD